MKYRKKQTIVEAEQFTGGWECLKLRGICVKMECNQGGPHVHTIHDNQAVRLETGDWILPEPDGVHFYPVKDAIFLASYENADGTQILTEPT